MAKCQQNHDLKFLMYINSQTKIFMFSITEFLPRSLILIYEFRTLTLLAWVLCLKTVKKSVKKLFPKKMEQILGG
jgi:hypothetical protein